MSALVTHPIGKLSKRIHSHKSSLGPIYAEGITSTGFENQVEVNFGQIDDYNIFDTLFLYHGNDFSGGLNLFGGVKNYGGIDSVIKLSEFRGKVFSLDIEMPKYSEMFAERFVKSNGSEHPDWKKVDWENLSKIEKTAEKFDPFNKYFNKDKLFTIGDSHATSLYRPGIALKSVPFKTLNGFINDDNNEINSFIYPKTDIELYFGNIDIRHHLCRENRSIPDLCDRYIAKAESIENAENITIYDLLPIEDESRKVPKSGFYKGTPFYGSWEERNKNRLIFRDYMLNKLEHNNKINYKLWTDYLVNDIGQLDFDYMEKPQSIHLSREFYPYWQGWKYNNPNERDKLLIKNEF